MSCVSFLSSFGQQNSISIEYGGGLDFLKVSDNLNSSVTLPAKYSVNRQLGHYQFLISFHHGISQKWYLHQSLGFMTLKGGIEKEEQGISNVYDFELVNMALLFGSSYALNKWFEPGFDLGIYPNIKYEYIDQAFDYAALFLIRPYFKFNLSSGRPIDLNIALGPSYMKSPLADESDKQLSGWGLDLTLKFQYNL